MKKLTKKQKAKNATMYRYIRKLWNKSTKWNTYREFRNIVLGRMKGTGESYREAARKTLHSKVGTAPSTVMKENLLYGLYHEFNDTYKELKKMMGKFNKGETMMGRLFYDSDKKMLSFWGSDKKQHWVDMSTSPKMAYIV